MTTPSSDVPQSGRSHFDTGPLSWVMGEVRETLVRSRTSLNEALSQDAESQITALKHAKTYLHQAHGALQIVDVDGVAIITETVEDIFERIEAGQITLSSDLVLAVENAYQALIEYLEELLTGAPHQPVRLFPYYRALLEVRGAERIHPSDLFFPNLAVRPHFPAAEQAVPLAPQEYGALRQRFERSLLPFLRSTDRSAELANATAMRDIVAKVESVQNNQQMRGFWWVMHGFAEAVAAGQIANELYVKQLFARINLQIRRLSEGSSSITERLLRDALFFIARARNPSTRQQQIRAAYQIDDHVPADYEKKRYGQVDLDALSAAKERLSQAKNLWNRIASGDASAADAFETEMNALSDAGTKLNAPSLAKLLRELSGIARHAAHSKPGDNVGLEMATSLLFVENALHQSGQLSDNFAERADAMTARLLSVVSGEKPQPSSAWLEDMSREAQQRQTMSALSGELQSSLRQVEKTLDEYFGNPGDQTHLEQINTILHQIGGALSILDQEDAVHAIQHTQKAIKRFAEAEEVPPVEEFQHIARNIGALSFLIEALQLYPDGANKRFVFDAERGILQANLIEKNALPQTVVDSEQSKSALPAAIIHEEPVVVAELIKIALPDESAHQVTEQSAQELNHGLNQDASYDSTSELLHESVIEAITEPALEFARVLPNALPHAPSKDLPTVEDDLAFHQKVSAELAVSLTAEPDNALLHDQLKESLEQVRLDATLVDNPEANGRAQAAIAMLDQPDFVASNDALANIVSATATQSPSVPIELAPSAAVPETDEAIDAELLEIFLIEAEEVLGAVGHTVPESRSAPYNQEHLTTLRRSFHTLKGSGRMVGLMAFGEAAWSIEKVLNQRLSETRPGDADLYALLDKASSFLADWVQDLQTTGKSARTPNALQNAAERIRDGLPFSYEEGDNQEVILAAALDEDEAPRVAEPVASETVLEAPHVIDTTDVDAIAANEEILPLAMSEPEEIQMSDAEMAAFAEATSVLPSEDQHSEEAPVVEETEASLTVDQEAALLIDQASVEEMTRSEASTANVIDFPTMHSLDVKKDDNVKHIGDLEISVPLHNIYLAETDELVRLLSQDIAEWRHESDRHVNILAVHAAHSLAGSSATVGFKPLQEIAHALEMALQYLTRKPARLTPDDYDTLEHGVERIRFMLQMFALGEMPDHEPAQVKILERLPQEIAARSEVKVDVAPVVHLAEPVLPEVQDIETLLSPTELIEPVASPVTDEMAGDDHLLADTVPEVVDMHDHVENDVMLADEPVATPVDDLAIESTDEPVIEEALADTMSSAVTAEDAVQIEAISEPVAPAEVAASDTPAIPAPTLEPVYAQNEANPDSVLVIKDELDADLLPVFVEEGRDMLPQMGEALRAWQQQPSDTRLPQSILRILHTVKGSARMAGAMGLGQHMHEMETRIEQIMRFGAPSPLALEELMGRHDAGLQMFEDIQNPQAKKATPALEIVKAQPVAPQEESASAPSSLVELKSLMPLRQGTAPAPLTPRATEVAAPAAASPLVRVRADILDRLVNQAGEVSISRSRLETEVGTLRLSLSELTENVSRLRSQLREIEMQAESQITSRMAHSADREFDPLEFDRFTRLQELTRMMAESVNDVSSVQQNLTRTVESASTDLNTQGRLTRELQQDLMRVRMVQFASISERLYRVTRQASKEVDKRVNLDIRGSAVEIDRSVLEKMAGPFEHLLRNAIVHGIESRERRTASGKNETGELLVEIRQEGNEVVIQFSDDGQGLNLNSIREKAKATGLLSDDRDMSDAEVTDLIFHPGFSTAEQVTELAGRGVGMDVVRSEAAGLGGRVAIVSEPGKGAHFTIHLPLTLAVTQVVILSTGGRTYAVPSVLVEQVQQLKTNPLAAAYNDGAVMWQGQRVPMYYLPALLGDTAVSAVAQQYSPLMILKSGADRVAIHVDEILGNREVVVKNIGPQLARMIGIAGATVLGSGEIVLILNPVPLAQRALHENIRAPRLVPSDTPDTMGAVAEMQVFEPSAPAVPPVAEAVQGLRTQTIVMVVDDSLTVRRVTQRLLTREGYQVVLAKDGVDALEHLQSITPDVMLVDIEMPRMDGFDLTRNVRSDERTKHIPIIMITSRTAAKHRNYAMELGVSEYLGKPYQEDELVKSIASFVSKAESVD